MKALKAHQNHQSVSKKLLSYVFYATLPLILLLCYFSPFPTTTHFSTDAVVDHFSSSTTSMPINSSPSSFLVGVKESKSKVLPSSPSALPSTEEGSEIAVLPSSALPPEENRSATEFVQEKPKEITSACNYTDGEWIKDETGPLYNGSSCGTIKEGQNCMSHGRPDKDYLYWKWKPRHCNVPRFDPESLLQILQGKHLAFVGDSLARNQLESLLCLLASFSRPDLVYSEGEENKFRRWHFASHNVVVSIYWSPFLIKGVEKKHDKDYNRLYVDAVDERWAKDLDSIDMLVLSIGQWYLLRGAYYEGSSLLGCHSVDDLNCTEVEYYDMFGKAFSTSLKAIIDRKGLQGNGNGMNVIVTTFSPHHFEGEWDKFGACPKTKPYTEGEIALEGMNERMRQIAVQEVEKAKAELNSGEHNTAPNVRVAVLDVTKLSLLRPDGHPGPYMYNNPFADGIKERVHNDCVHWCLPGPIDTWNEIMLDIIKKWHISH